MKNKHIAAKKIDNMDSLKRRYIFKLIANTISMVTGAVITLLVPRVLGPAMFGNFSFITEFFHSFISFFQLGTQNAFYTKLSKNQRDTKLIRFYGGFISLTFIVVIIIIIIFIFILKKQETVWPGVNEKIVFAGLLFGILTFLVAVFKNINDALGVTIYSEKVIIAQRLVGVSIIVVLYYLNHLNIRTFFEYHYFIMSFLILIWAKFLHKKGVNPFAIRISKVERFKYIHEFYKYSSPLMIYSVVTLFVDIGDRWLLQKFGGSVQQGYFSFAFRIMALSALFTSAMTPLIMREFTIAYKYKDFSKLGNLFKRNLPLIFFIGAFISVFVAFNKDLIISFVGGSGYEAGSLAFMIMAFYPIQQSYGQLSGSLFFATDQTKLYRNIAITVSLIGLLTTFFLLVPKSMGGLNLGATGLAIKKLFIQFIGVSTGLYFNTRYLGLSFIKFMGHQFLVVIILSGIAYGANGIMNLIIANNYLSFFLSGFVYTFLTLLLITIYPRIIAQNRNVISNYLSPILRILKK